MKSHLFLIGLALLTSIWVESNERHETGRDIYNYRCYYCHGYSGNGQTLAASMMKPAPLDFTKAPLDLYSRERMLNAVSGGTENSAMRSFSYFLDDNEMEAVVDFVRAEFMLNKNSNTQYHTPENGWPDHQQKYEIAFPFALGDLKIDTPPTLLSEEEKLGLRLYMTTCISCHDRGHVEDEGLIWRARSISFPRNNFSFTNFEQADASTGASVFLKHEEPIDPAWLTERQRLGQNLFSENCAFCHGEDGSGKNWIGAFLEQAPQDLTDPVFINNSSPESLFSMISYGKKDTSMPAWKYVLGAEQIELLIDFVYANAEIRHQQQ